MICDDCGRERDGLPDDISTWKDGHQIAGAIGIEDLRARLETAASLIASVGEDMVGTNHHFDIAVMRGHDRVMALIESLDALREQGVTTK